MIESDEMSFYYLNFVIICKEMDWIMMKNWKYYLNGMKN